MALDVLIVADIRLYREGLAQVLDRDERINVLGTADSKARALEQMTRSQPDAVLVDMALSKSLDTVRAIVATAPAAKVVALAMPENESEVIACAEAGVSGYVPRDGSLEDLIATLRGVDQGELPCSPRVAGVLLREVRRLATTKRQTPEAKKLTRRQLEVLALVDDGLTNKEIAGRLHVSPATVKNHVHNILDKLNVHHREDAASRVGRENLHRRESGAANRARH